MKVVVYTNYGTPDELQVKDVAKPVPTDDELLIKIHSKVPEALQYLGEGHAKGKLVITINWNSNEGLSCFKFKNDIGRFGPRERK